MDYISAFRVAVFIVCVVCLVVVFFGMAPKRRSKAVKPVGAEEVKPEEVPLPEEVAVPAAVVEPGAVVEEVKPEEVAVPGAAVVEEAPATPAGSVASTASTQSDYKGILASLDKYKQSWDQEGASAKINIELGQALAKHFGAKLESPSEGEDDGAAPPGETEVMITSAIATGNIGTDMKTKVAQLWNLAKSKDPKLSEAYNALGKEYRKQREFRMQWAKGEAEKFKQERIYKHTQELMGEVKGTYKTFGMIWKAEGKDPVGFEVAKNVVMSCLDLHSQGKKLYGRPWLQINKQKKYPEFLVVEESVSFKDRETWGYKEVSASASSVPTGGGGGEPDGGKRKREPETNKQDEGAPGDISDDDMFEVSSKKSKKAITEEQKTEQKQLITQLTKLKQFRREVSQVCSDCSELLSVVSSAKAWEYANNEPYLRPVREARDKMVKFKEDSEFWSAFMIEDNFVAYSKKHFKISEIKRELGKFEDMKTYQQDLSFEVANIKRMHAARATKDK